MRVALDAMGGDLAPREQVLGALLAAKEFGIEVALVGPPDVIEPELAKHPKSSRVSVVAAGDAITMDEGEIVKAVRTRRDASINVATQMVKKGEASAVVSAGNSGAVSASAFFLLGRISGVERPALGMLLPYNAGRVFLIDAGANPNCRASHLLQFAQMGSAYVERVVGIKQPRIGLLNIGEEEGKGNDLAVEAYDRLKDSGLNFVGNVEGVNIHKAVCDVIVTDGFTGNVALKAGEGVADYILEQVRSVIKSSPLFIGAAILLKPALRRALNRLKYEEYGGAYLMGIDGVVVIAHGRSDALAIKNALRLAHSAAGTDLLETMRASFVESKEESTAGGR
ncbi:MAG TPA: phosphate acyltransferase PlsX [Dehalococcoidia bacterium]|nr:phosphate acyltransferase PlsX [Dehalococcoidia bacterium]